MKVSTIFGIILWFLFPIPNLVEFVFFRNFVHFKLITFLVSFLMHFRSRVSFFFNQDTPLPFSICWTIVVFYLPSVVVVFVVEITSKSTTGIWLFSWFDLSVSIKKCQLEIIEEWLSGARPIPKRTGKLFKRTLAQVTSKRKRVAKVNNQLPLKNIAQIHRN